MWQSVMGFTISTLLMLKLQHSWLIRSVALLLMSWLFTSPGHKTGHGPCRINRSLSSVRKDFNYLRLDNVEIWWKIQIWFSVSLSTFSTTRVKMCNVAYFMQSDRYTSGSPENDSRQKQKTWVLLSTVKYSCSLADEGYNCRSGKGKYIFAKNLKSCWLF